MHTLKRFFRPKRAALLLLALCVVFVGWAGYQLQNARADAPTLYYFANSVNTDPTELGNYWLDADLTNPALGLPDYDVDAIIVTAGSTYNGSLTLIEGAINYGEITGNGHFKSGSLNDGSGTVNGDAIFDDSQDSEDKLEAGINTGTVEGDAEFHNNGNNNGSVEGNALFYDNSSHGGTIAGNATFYENDALNAGSVTGTKTRHYSIAVTPARDFITDGPWTVVADGVEIDLLNSLIDGTTTLVETNGGNFINDFLIRNLYFSNSVDTSPSELGNYWDNPALNDPAGSLPNFSIDRVTVVAGATFAGNITINGAAVNEGTVTGNATFNDTSSNEGTVQGTSTFTGTSTNYGVLSGAPRIFNGSSSNFAAISGDVTFDGSSSNRAAITGTVSFDGSSRNYNNIVGAVTFDDSSRNESAAAISGSPIFNSNSINAGTITGNVTFKDSSSNEASGIVNGNAIFYGNGGNNSGTVSGTKTRYYNDGYIAVSRNFVTGGPWTVVADGVIVKITGSTYDSNTTFSTLNKGFFSTTPAGSPESISSTSASTLPATSGAYVTIMNNKAYQAGNNKIVVYNIDTGVVEATVNVPAGTDLYMGRYGNKLYIPDGETSVSVFDTTTNTITATLTVGNGAKTISTLGTKLYVTCQSASSVSVIDGLTDTVIASVGVGQRPFYSSVLGNKVYVSNNGTDVLAGQSVSVINGSTNTVEATIHTGIETVLSTAVGTKLYVSNKLSDTMSVIDTLTNTVVATIPTGECPEQPVLVGTKIYVNNRCSSDVTIIDTVTDEVYKHIAVGTGPYYITASGNTVFSANEASNTVSVIDTLSNTVPYVATVGSHPFYLASTASHVYVPNQFNSYLSIIDINNVTLPALMSFSTDTPDGQYGAGERIKINALFNRTLESDSNMTVRLSTGALLELTEVNDMTISGTYTVNRGEEAPDLFVADIESAAVTDTLGHTRTSYALPFSEGNFIGENSLIRRTIGDSANIMIGDYERVQVGANPYQISSPVTVANDRYVYVANQGDATVSVLRIADNKVVKTIDVGSEPYGVSLATVSGVVYVYIANTNGNTVSVINTSTNEVVDTIAVGIKPYYVATVGTKVYVTNGQSNTVSVINAVTNTVTATISVGGYPRGIKAIGTDVYVANYGDPFYASGGNSISVINSLTDQVTNTIVSPAGSLGPRGVTTFSGSVYVTNYLSGNVSVIDPNTKQIIDTIPVGDGPRGIVGYNNRLYVENFDDSTVTVIDAGTHDVLSTIQVGHSPAGITAIDAFIYISNFQDDTLLIYDTKKQRLLQSERGGGGGGIVLSGSTDDFDSSALPSGSTSEPLPMVTEACGAGVSTIDCEAQALARLVGNGIETFITHGTVLTASMGSGERSGVIESFKTTYGREPAGEEDWSDVLKISLGRWPTQRSPLAEARSQNFFSKIYQRKPDLTATADSAALTIMSYGMRPTHRNLGSESAALHIYNAIFKQLPGTSIAWDLVRAIAYSGAER